MIDEFKDFDTEEVETDEFADFDTEEVESEEITFDEGEGSMPLTEKYKEPETGRAEAALLGLSEGLTAGTDKLLGGLGYANLTALEDQYPLEDIAAGVQDLITKGDEGRKSIKDKLEYLKMKKDLGIKEEKGEEKDLLDEISVGKDLMTKQINKAYEDRPLETGIGSTLGSIPLAAEMAGPKALDKINRLRDKAEKARKLKNFQTAKDLSGIASKEGYKLLGKESVKHGTVSGLGKAKDMSDVPESVLGEVAFNLGTGGTLAATGELAKSIFKAIPGARESVESYVLGTLGKNIDSELVESQIKRTSKKYINRLNKSLSKLDLEKGQLREIVDNMGITINTKEDLLIARENIKNIKSKTVRDKAQKFLDVIEEHLGYSKELQKNLDDLTKKSAKKNIADPLAEGIAKAESKSFKRQLRSPKEIVDVNDTNIYSNDLGMDMNPREGYLRTEKVRGKDEFGNEKIFTRKQVEDVTPYDPEVMDPSKAGPFRVDAIKDKSTGKVPDIAFTRLENLSKFDPEKLSVKDAEDLIDQINTDFSVLSESGNKLPAKITREATELVKKLKEKVKGAYRQAGEGTPLTDIDTIDKKFSKYLETKKLMGVDKRDTTALNKDLNYKQLASFIEGAGDKEVVSNFELVLKRLDEIDPETFKMYSDEITDLRRMAELARGDMALQSAGSGSILGTASSLVNKFTNLMGRMSRTPKNIKQGITNAASKASRSRLGKASAKFIKDTTPESIQNMITELSRRQGDSVLIDQLQKAMKAPETKRRAILFSLYNNAAFRTFLKDISSSFEGDKS